MQLIFYGRETFHATAILKRSIHGRQKENISSRQRFCDKQLMPFEFFAGNQDAYAQRICPTVI